MYTLYNQIYSPLTSRPFAIGLYEAGNNLLTWGGYCLLLRFMPEGKLKTLAHLFLNGLRFYSNPLTALLGIAGILLIHYFPLLNNRNLPNEMKALLYLLIRESSNLYDYYDNIKITGNYEKKLKTKITDPYQEAEKYFLIHHNVPLKEAEILIFTEDHSNQTHRDLQGLFISLMSQKGDYVLFEGADPSIQIPCYLMPSILHSPHNTVLPKIADSRRCTGWDDHSIAVKLFKPAQQDVIVRAEANQLNMRGDTIRNKLATLATQITTTKEHYTKLKNGCDNTAPNAKCHKTLEKLALEFQSLTSQEKSYPLIKSP